VQRKQVFTTPECVAHNKIEAHARQLKAGTSKTQQQKQQQQLQ
jgi:hypothetical protein